MCLQVESLLQVVAPPTRTEDIQMNNVLKVFAVSLIAVMFAGCDSDEPEQTDPEIMTNESMGSPDDPKLGDSAMDEDDMEKKNEDDKIVIPTEGVDYKEN